MLICVCMYIYMYILDVVLIKLNNFSYVILSVNLL